LKEVKSLKKTRSSSRTKPVVFKSPVKVKICGITCWSDAVASIDAGADALGFNFYEKSPRFLNLSKAAAIIRKLPPFVSVVGVFVNPVLEKVKQALMTCRLDYLQMHGQESPEFLANFPKDKLIKAFRVRDQSFLREVGLYSWCSARLLDSFVMNKYGGSGKVFDWKLARNSKLKNKPLILSGGLNADNVAQAVSLVSPWGVDTASGVESRPGKKCGRKLVAFVTAAKKYGVKYES
jgi:phosphoribosylanthranilate isomerase